MLCVGHAELQLLLTFHIIQENNNNNFISVHMAFFISVFQGMTHSLITVSDQLQAINN